jgi:preprotein translocase subunit SecG
MYTVLMVVQVLVAVSLIGLILIQHGKGADAGAAFGSGASSTVFGSRGSANFLSRTTAWLATVFFAVSLALAYLVHGTSRETGSVVDKVQQSQPETGGAGESPAPSNAPVVVPEPEAPKVPE